MSQISCKAKSGISVILTACVSALSHSAWSHSALSHSKSFSTTAAYDFSSSFPHSKVNLSDSKVDQVYNALFTLSKKVT